MTEEDEYDFAIFLEGESGESAKTCPVTSAIRNCALLGEMSKPLPYDSPVYNFIRNAIPKDFEKLSLNFDLDKVPLPSFTPRYPKNGESWEGFGEIFSDSRNYALAAELQLATGEVAKTVRASMEASKASRKFSDISQNSSPVHVEMEVEGTSGKNRKTTFLSAKDQYKQEGGILDVSKAKSESKTNENKDEKLPPQLAHCDKALVERIEADIIHRGQSVTFDDIAGLEFAKECVNELICWPMNQPHLFQGLRSLPRGILLFGPPGTGKTLIGKAIAHQSGATFFSISASSLMSKWIGEGEKTVRTLFEVANYRQPSVVFIDEVDSLLCQRSSDENEATRRIKTEFMVQLDGASTKADCRVVIIGATNRPEELDEAVRRRFVKRIYIPLPEMSSRLQLFQTLLNGVNHSIKECEVEQLVRNSRGYSGADIRALCTEAAMGPIREIAIMNRGSLQNINPRQIPPVTMKHFDSAFETVSPTVSPSDLTRYLDWNKTFGSFRKIDGDND